MKWKARIAALAAAVIGLFVCICLLLSLHQTDSGAEFEQLCTQLFDQELRSSTLNMHYLLARPSDFGFTDYEVTLGQVLEDAEKEGKLNEEGAALTETGDSSSLRPDAGAQERFSLENFRTRLSRISKESLSREDARTYEVLCDYIDLQLSSEDLSLYPELLSPSSGIQSQLPILLAEYPFRSETDITDYLTLLSQIPAYYDQICLYESKRAEKELVMADYSLQKVIDQCNDFLWDTESHFLKSTFEKRVQECSFLNAEEQTAMIDENKALLDSQVFPAYRKLADFASSLMGRGTNDGGIGAYPSGKAYYEYLVKYLTGTDYSVSELKNLLESQWLKDYSRLSGLINHSGALYTASDGFQSSSDPNVMLDDLKQKIAKDFPALRDTSCTVKYVDPSLEPYLSPAFYLTPPIDDSSRNIIYINKSAGYTGLQLYTTLAHEGYPGHLYQSVYLNEQKLPLVRYLPYYGGYIEGWGLYVEMYSYGLADMNPDLAEMERLNHSLYLCLYALLDLHIHYDCYTLEDTFRFMSSFGKFDEEAVRSLYQYIVEEPANYLKYYVGYLEICRLRDTARRELGEDFSLKEFHDFYLAAGPAPFDLLEKWWNEENRR